MTRRHHFLILLFTALVSHTLAQQAVLSPYILDSSYRVVINERSSLSIHGKTNVNKFECGFGGTISADTLYIASLRTEGEQVLRKAQLRISVADFDCGMKLMTEDMLELLNAKDFPFLSVTVLSLKKKGNIHESIARFTIAGKSRDYKVPLTAKQSADWTYCVGTNEINIRDFGLTPPSKYWGAVKVDEIIQIEFNLILKIIEVP
jgi:hypothetical protein